MTGETGYDHRAANGGRPHPTSAPRGPLDPVPFTVAVPPERVEDMFRRLRTAAWVDDDRNTDGGYGLQRSWLEGMVDHWVTSFDWAAAEAELNKLPHFRVVVDGVPVHFVHVRGRNPGAFPVVLTHGWPWTFWDWRGVVRELEATGDFDIVIPSLPGFVFSGPDTGWGPGAADVARLWARLMTDVLGYSRFGACGGDWGGLVTGQLAVDGPEGLVGCVLLTAGYPGLDRSAIPADAWAPDEVWMAERAARMRSTITAHVSVGIDAPQTLAHALGDSPLGTAAWLWAPRHAWTGSTTAPEVVFGADFLCVTASLYWLMGTAGSAMRFYRDNARSPMRPGPRSEVPVGVVVAPGDVVFAPRAVVAEHLRLERWTVLPEGGHFAPAERPTEVAGELVEFFAGIGATPTREGSVPWRAKR